MSNERLPSKLGPYRVERRPEEGLVLHRSPSGMRLFWWIAQAAVLVAVGVCAYGAGFADFMAALVAGTLVLVAGFVRGYLEMGHGIISRVARHVVVRKERRATTYRAAPTPREIVVDDRSFALESARRLFVAHHVYRSRQGTTHVYPVYLVLDREVFRLHDFEDEGPALALAGLLQRELGLDDAEAVEAIPAPGPEGASFYVVGTLSLLVGVAFPMAMSFSSLEDATGPRVLSCAIAGVLTIGFAWFTRWLVVTVGRGAARRYAAHTFGIDS